MPGADKTQSRGIDEASGSTTSIAGTWEGARCQRPVLDGKRGSFALTQTGQKASCQSVRSALGKGGRRGGECSLAIGGGGACAGHQLEK